MLVTIQWVNVPLGASGSSTRIAMLLVPVGTFDHDSGGVFSPRSQVYSLGIAAPLSNALDVTLICAMVARSPFLPCADSASPTRLASENRREIDVRMRS